MRQRLQRLAFRLLSGAQFRQHAEEALRGIEERAR